MIASLSVGAAAAEGFAAAFALGGVVALSGIVLWALHSSCMASTHIAAPNTMTILKLFFIGVSSPRRHASPGYEALVLAEDDCFLGFIPHFINMQSDIKKPQRKHSVFEKAE
jgi:hypothetical protein